MARTASYILDSVWKKVDVLSFDRSCFNFTSINIKSFFQIYNAILVGAPDYALHQLHMRCQFFAPGLGLKSAPENMFGHRSCPKNLGILYVPKVCLRPKSPPRKCTSNSEVCLASLNKLD